MNLYKQMEYRKRICTAKVCLTQYCISLKSSYIVYILYIHILFIANTELSLFCLVSHLLAICVSPPLLA